MKKTILFICFLLIPFLSFSETADEKDLALIVSLENPAKKITRDNLRAIYLGEKKVWDNGLAIFPLDLEESDELRNFFIRKILKKNPSNLKFYWVQQIFTGRGSPPLVLKKDRRVREFVASHSGAIGYIHAGQVNSTVKRIRLVE